MTFICRTTFHERIQRTFMNIWSQYVHKNVWIILSTYWTYVHQHTRNICWLTFLHDRSDQKMMIICWTYESHTMMNVRAICSSVYVAHMSMKRTELCSPYVHERMLQMLFDMLLIRRAYDHIRCPYVKNLWPTYDVTRRTLKVCSVSGHHTMTYCKHFPVVCSTYVVCSWTYVQHNVSALSVKPQKK